MSYSKNVQTNGNSTYFFDSYLTGGTYMFLINAPFNTQMFVSPLNPVPGLRFVDKDPTPNVFNAELSVPKEGQYGFKVIFDRPINNGMLEVKIIKQETQNGGGASGGGQSKIKLWNRIDIRDCITSYLRSRNLNEWGGPNTPGVVQSTPGSYLSGKYENRFEWFLNSLTYRKVILAKLPQYEEEMSELYGPIYY